MKLKDIIEGAQALQNIGKEIIDVKTAYAYGKFLRKVKQEAEAYEEMRQVLVRKYGKTDKESNILSVTIDNQEAFQNDIKELLDADVDLAPCEFSISTITNKASSNDIMLAIPFFAEELEESAEQKNKPIKIKRRKK